MKKATAILIWGILLWAIGTFIDQVRDMLMTGGDPVTIYIFRFGASFLLVIAAVLVGRWLRRWTGKRMFPGDWFMAGAVAWVGRGIYVWELNRTGTMDFHIHDTYYVIGHPHIAGGMVLLYMLIGLTYYANRAMKYVPGLIHFFVTHAAFFVLLWLKYYNPAYQVKQYLAYSDFVGYGTVTWGYTLMAFLLIGAQLLFIVNLFLSLLTGDRARNRRRGRRLVR